MSAIPRRVILAALLPVTLVACEIGGTGDGGGDLLNEARPPVSHWGPGVHDTPDRLVTMTSEQFVEAVGHEDRIAPIQWMTVDPGGRLWLSRTSDGVGTEQVDVLEAGGRYRGSLETDAMPVAFVSETRFVGLTRSRATGEVALVLHDLRAPEGEWPADDDPTRPEWTEAAERPQVEVTIDHRLAIGKYEVTFDEWNRCVEDGGRDHEPDDEG